MNIQRFTAPTAREALAKARNAFGEGTLILSNRATAAGVEVLATGEDTLAALDRGEGLATRRTVDSAGAAAPRPVRASEHTTPTEDANALSMSTLSFQDYVRERMLRRRQESLHGAQAPQPALTTSPSKASTPRPPTDPALLIEPFVARAPSTNSRSTKAVEREPALIDPNATQGILREIQAMKSMIDERFTTLAWWGQARQSPIHANLMLKLIRAGYSPTLARTILERVPDDASAADAMRWLLDTLARNIHTDAPEGGMVAQGGVYALIGSTGVGKTTTAAKLAGRCAQAHGVNSVGLITLDTYRVGAHEQLRAFGRMLGVVAHLAHDRAALQDLLGLLANKKMVLIDTTGVAPQDPRKRDMLDVLDLPGVSRVLVLNAGSHGDTLDDVVSAFKTEDHQQAILTKTDEASKVGPALDAVIRHQLHLRGVTHGQKVPEDWAVADASELVAQSMRAPSRSAFDPSAQDLGFYFAGAPTLGVKASHA